MSELVRGLIKSWFLFNKIESFIIVTFTFTFKILKCIKYKFSLTIGSISYEIY